MYTVEFESDASIIITLDQKETHEDVEVVMADDGQVYLRQYEEEMDSYQMIIMSHQVEPEDPEDDNSGPIKLAFTWPMVAFEVIYLIFVGEKDDDGTGTN